MVFRGCGLNLLNLPVFIWYPPGVVIQFAVLVCQLINSPCRVSIDGVPRFSGYVDFQYCVSSDYFVAIFRLSRLFGVCRCNLQPRCYLSPLDSVICRLVFFTVYRLLLGSGDCWLDAVLLITRSHDFCSALFSS